MRAGRFNHRLETYEQWRQRMLDDTAKFIEWGLAHPEEVEWIPKQPVGRDAFSERVKRVCWGVILGNKRTPE